MTVPVAICLIGAECTGKTSLAAALAAHFDGLWVGEHLREFCALHGRTPCRDEQLGIMEQQFQLEKRVLDQAEVFGKRWVFCDTAPLLTAVCSEFYFEDRSLYPRARALHARYLLTLNLQPDIPWVKDGIQRDGAHVRAPVQAIIDREMQLLALPYCRIAGCGDARRQAAIDVIQALRG
jgi:nicotinamide riboside kinase